MSESSSLTDERIAVTAECRGIVRRQKRGGETFDSVLWKMVENYESPNQSEGPDVKSAAGDE